MNRALRLGFDEGDGRAVSEYEEAIELAREIGSPEITRGYINLASLHNWLGDKQIGAELHHHGWAIAQRFGDIGYARFLSAEIVLDRLSAGRWDQALADAVDFIDACQASPHYMESAAQIAVVSILLARDDVAGARAHLDRLGDLAAEIQEPQVTIPTHALRARFLSETGDLDGARQALAALPDAGSAARRLLDPAYVGAAAAASDIGTPELMMPILRSASAETPWTRAISAVIEGRLAAAARECSSAQEPFYAAMLTLRAAERGEVVERAQVDDAATFFRTVGASRYLPRLAPVSLDTG